MVVRIKVCRKQGKKFDIFIFSNINFIKKVVMFDNKFQPRELPVAKVIKVLTELLLSYSDKISLFKLNQRSHFK